MDIVERLRNAQSNEWNGLMMELAADEIERLREALRVIGYGPPHEDEPLELLNQFVDIARAALKEGK